MDDPTKPALQLVVPLLTALALTAFVLLNLDGRQGLLQLAMWLVAAGWLLNLSVIAANGGMPTPAEVLTSTHPGGVLNATCTSTWCCPTTSSCGGSAT